MSNLNDSAHRRFWPIATLLLGLVSVAGCRSSDKTSAPAVASTPRHEAQPTPAPSAKPQGIELDAPPVDGPILGAQGLYVMIRNRPAMEGAKRLGYIRLGGVVQRDELPVGGKGCKGGWYKVRPEGYACLDKDATLDPKNLVLQAASRRPNLSLPMPYAYGFVRSVLPLYLKVPSSQEQIDSEFKLKDHLEWWKQEGRRFNEVTTRWANDVFIDQMGVPHDGQNLPKPAAKMGEGELFGGKGEDDPIPWWLQGGRKIPNVSAFQVPDTAIFADRARRFTGLAFVGSFPTGPDSLSRRFAITEDLRLAPTTKLKPDGGSAFHGVEIGPERRLPFAWIKENDAWQYQVDGDKVRAYKQRLTYRNVVNLTGKKKLIDQRMYYEMPDGKWVRLKSMAIAAEPKDKPQAAKDGAKWIDISIRQQTLVLWEGNTPVYATLVSSGQDMLGDPKTTKSTPTGTFRIRSKHVTKEMDSNEGLTRDSGDAEYGKSKRRGQGTFRLDHVPWIQYFKGGYALHGAHWHDVFGQARSHGCVNLAPIDAHRIFFWTEPKVPQGWHGVYVGPDSGTVVYIHE